MRRADLIDLTLACPCCLRTMADAHTKETQAPHLDDLMASVRAEHAGGPLLP